MTNKSFQNTHQRKAYFQASKYPLTPFTKNMLPEGTYLFNLEIISCQISRSSLPNQKKEALKASLKKRDWGDDIQTLGCMISSWQIYPQLLLMMITLGLWLPSSAAYAEVIQVSSLPNLPPNLPPPQDVVPPTSQSFQQLQFPEPTTATEDLLSTEPPEELLSLDVTSDFSPYVEQPTQNLTSPQRNGENVEMFQEPSLELQEKGFADALKSLKVAQVPSVPNLPQPLPPPQDVVPPVSPPSEQPQVPSSPTPDLLPIQPTQPSEEFPSVVSEKFLVTKFEFVGGTVFKDEQLLLVIENALLAGGDKRFCPPLPSIQSECIRLPRSETDPPVEITFAQLLEARSAITQFYIDKGYITSGALIPEQALPPGGGVVKIQLAEGSLEDIQIIGTRRLNPKYISSRLQRANKKPLNRDRLLEALQVLQLNPLIESLSAELAAGSRFGRNLLLVKVTEAKSFHTQVSLDNNRSPSVGSFQRSLQLTEGNLLGIGDGISLRYANTDGSNQVDVGYTLPLSPQNTTLGFNYSYSANNVIEKPFDELDISSNSSEYQLTLRHPVIQTPRQELALGITASHRESQTFLGFEDIGGFPLSPGADEKGRTKVTALRLFQEFTQRGDRSVLAFRSQFSLGIDALDATINNDDEPDSRFFAWRGQAQLVRLLAKDTLLLIRGDVQLADTRLLSSEQIGLGGQASIRGYRQDLLLADNGAFGSVELRVPILRLRKQQGLLQVVPFVDIGTAWNNSGGADIKTDFLASAGLGLRFQLSDRLNARFDWGIPIVSVNSSSKTQQEDGLYLSVLWNPF